MGLLWTCRSLIRRLRGVADRERWARPESFEPLWAERSKLIARLVPPGSRVLELGAGVRGVGDYLEPACVYYHSDLLRRRPDTLVIDLEREDLPSLEEVRPDVAVFAGVLEYLSDVERVLRWIAPKVRICIASYECARGGNAVQRALESWERASHGWISCWTEAELAESFRRLGFACAAVETWHTREGPEPVFVFSKGHIDSEERM